MRIIPAILATLLLAAALPGCATYTYEAAPVKQQRTYLGEFFGMSITKTEVGKKELVTFGLELGLWAPIGLHRSTTLFDPQAVETCAAQ